MADAPVAVSWSGGKDSCLALYRAIRQGYRVTTLLNFVARDTQRCCFHGLPCDVMAAQAEALGIPLLMHPVPDDMREYEQEFKRAVAGLYGIRGMVFGDIYLDEHRAWVERVCKDIGISCIEPLWNEPTVTLMEEFIDLGFRAVVVSAKSDLFCKEFVGRTVDRALVRGLCERGICPCGENGEFHTLVVDGPIFKERIEVTSATVVPVDGFWKHWALEIQQYRRLRKDTIAV